MDDQQVTTPDEPVAEVAAPVAPAEPAQDEPVQPIAEVETPVAEPQAEESEEDEYPQYQLPPVPALDFNNLPVGEDNLIDPNALAGAVNQTIQAAMERATLQAQQSFNEQRAEEKNWEKAYDKYPELKSNKELRDLVQNARIGEFSDKLTRSKDGNVKFPSPSQTAERIFKYMGNAKQEGMKQATANTVIQQSAHVETSGRTSNESSDARNKAYQNINNPNKNIAKQARTDLLKSMLFGEE